jgi:predicted nucleic acid-binding protein
LIGWLLDTNVTAEIISAGGSARVKGWAAQQDEARLYLSILTIAEYDKGIANLPDGDPRRIVYMTTRDSRRPFWQCAGELTGFAGRGRRLAPADGNEVLLRPDFLVH